MTKYDSSEETKKHIRRVQEIIADAQGRLAIRAQQHDASKLDAPEKEILDVMTPKLRGVTYGSDEYRAMMLEMKPMIEHHNAHNPHHPEHVALWKCPQCHDVFRQSSLPPAFPKMEGDTMHETWFCPHCVNGAAVYECKLERHVSMDGMSLLDLLEMLCDWRAATERHADGSIAKSLSINRKRFSVSDQLYAVLENTAREMGWI